MAEEAETQSEEQESETPRMVVAESTSSEVSQPASLREWSQRPWLKILAGVLGILVFAGAVFGAYKLGQKQIPSGPVERPTPIPAVVATPTPEPTAGWETLTFDGFAIKHPNSWVYLGKGGCGPAVSPSETEDYWVAICLFGDKDPQTEAERISRLEFMRVLTPQTQIMVGNTSGIIQVLNDTSAKLFQTEVYLKNERGLHVIYGFARSQSLLEEYQPTFNLMLSTFRFLEEGAGVNCQALETLEMEELTQISKNDCQKCGGEWGLLSMDLDLTGCNPKTSDAGRACTDNDQCIGVCLAEEMSSTSGTCSEYKYRLGCSLEFSEGEPVMICRD